MSQDKLREAIQEYRIRLINAIDPVALDHPQDHLDFIKRTDSALGMNAHGFIAAAPVEGLSEEEKEALLESEMFAAGMRCGVRVSPGRNHAVILTALVRRLLARQPEAGAKPDCGHGIEKRFIVCSECVVLPGIKNQFPEAGTNNQNKDCPDYPDTCGETSCTGGCRPEAVATNVPEGFSGCNSVGVISEPEAGAKNCCSGPDSKWNRETGHRYDCPEATK